MLVSRLSCLRSVPLVGLRSVLRQGPGGLMKPQQQVQELHLICTESDRGYSFSAAAADEDDDDDDEKTNVTLRPA